MNMNAQAYNQYKKTSVETVAPEKLLLMLFDGALKNINNAKKAIEAKDINLAHQEIVKTEDIIIELMSTLNMDYEISLNLFALYEYLLYQLTQANYKKDTAILNEVEEFLTEIRETWAEVAKAIKTTPTLVSQANEAAPRTSINVKG